MYKGVSAHAPITGVPIPVPENFPVSWENTADAQFYWTLDRAHTPGPITPLFFSLIPYTSQLGRQRVVPVYESLVQDRQTRRINTYLYMNTREFSGSPDEVAARLARSQKKIQEVMYRLDEMWSQSWYPELMKLISAWDAFPLSRVRFDELMAHVEETIVSLARLWEINFLLSPPMWSAIKEFEDLYCNIVHGASKLDAHRFLRGFDNKTLQMNRAMWILGKHAKENPQVRRALIEKDPSDILPALSSIRKARGFLDELGRFLNTYGCRSDLWDWGYPSWIEDPRPVLSNLRHYVSETDRDLELEHSQVVAERDQLTVSIRKQLLGYPQRVRDEFERLLAAAQIALVLTEDHAFYIDFTGVYRARRVFLELGHRFTHAGILHEPADIFLLTIHEIRSASSTLVEDLRPLAETRRNEMSRWRTVRPPSELGTRPVLPQQLHTPDAQRQASADIAPPPSQRASGEIRGQAGSPGRVEGRACVVTSIGESHKLRKGDVLVVETTAPAWSSMFLTAAAVVTDAGGFLSHAATLAREYGIPAVVAAGTATSQIEDGQILQVDGSAGVVRILVGAQRPLSN